MILSGPTTELRRRLPPEVYLSVREVRAVVTRRRSAAPLERQLGVGRSGRALVRPLERADEASWGTAMRSSYVRMAPSWSFGADVDAATDRVTFTQHQRGWQRRLRRGEGACLALVSPAGVEGEVHLWNMRTGGLTCELGLWVAPEPHIPAAELLSPLGYVCDRLFYEVGIRRIEAPVPVGNALPRSIMELGGFTLEATLRQWREMNGRLVDFDLFALTPERWRVARPAVWDAGVPWRPVGD